MTLNLRGLNLYEGLAAGVKGSVKAGIDICDQLDLLGCVVELPELVAMIAATGSHIKRAVDVGHVSGIAPEDPVGVDTGIFSARPVVVLIFHRLPPFESSLAVKYSVPLNFVKLAG